MPVGLSNVRLVGGASYMVMVMQNAGVPILQGDAGYLRSMVQSSPLFRGGALTLDSIVISSKTVYVYFHANANRGAEVLTLGGVGCSVASVLSEARWGVTPLPGPRSSDIPSFVYAGGSQSGPGVTAASTGAPVPQPGCSSPETERKISKHYEVSLNPLSAENRQTWGTILGTDRPPPPSDRGGDYSAYVALGLLGTLAIVALT